MREKGKGLDLASNFIVTLRISFVNFVDIYYRF